MAMNASLSLTTTPTLARNRSGEVIDPRMFNAAGCSTSTSTRDSVQAAARRLLPQELTYE